MPVPDAVTIAVDAYSDELRRADAKRTAAAERQRADIIARFPVDGWPTLPLERYALGQEDSMETYCRWLEFRSLDLGSIQGGSAHKHIIYKHLKKPGWHFNSAYANEQAAWQDLRAGFVTALAYAADGRWNDIDAITAIRSGAALTLKTLYIYHPNDVLPIYSRAHLAEFLKLLTAEEPEAGAGPVQLNRRLLEVVKSISGLDTMSTLEVQYFLYRFFDPRETARMVKVAPGHDAEFWEECLAGGYICIGWDELGDLSVFDSKEEFQATFEKVFGDDYKGHKPTIAKKANEVWMFRGLEPGDLVLANRGTSQVLGLGKVVDPGYVWDEARNTYKSTVRVDWDASYAQPITPQKNWPFVTVAKVPDALRELVLTKATKGSDAASVGTARPTPSPVDPLFGEISDALKRKQQVILYGPPGTGKTYQARRFGVWWLRQRDGVENPGAVLADREAFAAVERDLTGQTTRRVWWVVASPDQWSWTSLANEETVTFRFGRLARNFAAAQPGDLVVGYESTPAKRIAALARVTRLIQTTDYAGPKIELRGVSEVRNGPTYEDLREHSILGRSEPMRFRNQGTLFALTDDEASEVLSLIAAADPDVTVPELDENKVGRLTRVTFHPSYGYEDFIEGYRPVASSGTMMSLRLKDGVFKAVCKEATAHRGKDYLVLVDEINRANVAKVFGELITLLEPDKRGMRTVLAQSGENFHVPPNVYVLGTMNTSDRSIRLLDVALRRRFGFIELMPDIELLAGATVGPLPVDEFLTRLNEEISKVAGRDKQLGHAYFLEDGQPVSDSDRFAQIFRQDIVPLLQEYCYDDYKRLTELLGERLAPPDAQRLNSDVLGDAPALLDALHSRFVSEPD